MKDYASPREARQELRAYLRFYHVQRIHQALDYQTPAEVYFARRLENPTPVQGEGELWLPHKPLAKPQSKA